MKRGFTLVEMMVSLSISTLIVAGALTLHTSFQRQNVRHTQLAEVQQTLRVAAQVLAQAIRGAGNGLFGGTLQIQHQSVMNTNCPSKFTGVTTSCYYPVQFSNHNVYPAGNLDANPEGPTPYTDTAVGDVDDDPDWLRIVSLDGETPAGLAAPVAAMTEWLADGTLNLNPCPSAAVISLCVRDGRGFNDPEQLFYAASFITGRIGSCVRKATGFSPAPGLTPVPTLIEHANNAFNPPGLSDPCFANNMGPVYRRDHSKLFRVDLSDPRGPRLMASYTRPGAAPDWKVLADGVEDLQIALLLHNGTICNSTDVVGSCDPRHIDSVRITLVARSRSPLAGFPRGSLEAIEDRPARQFTDGYLRRSFITQVDLRNGGEPFKLID